MSASSNMIPTSGYGDVHTRSAPANDFADDSREGREDMRASREDENADKEDVRAEVEEWIERNVGYDV